MESHAGLREAAIVLLSLGGDLAIEVCRFLDEATVQALAQVISELGVVPADEQATTVTQFVTLCRDGLASEGEELAQRLLHGALGHKRYAELFSHDPDDDALEFLGEVETRHVSAAFQGERPQALSLVVARMSPDKAADLLVALPDDVRGEVALRLAQLGRVAPGVFAEIERRLIAFGEEGQRATQETGGVESLVAIAGHLDRGTQQAVLKSLAEQDESLAERVEEALFSFDDAVALGETALQAVMRRVDSKDIALALKGSDEETRERLLSCLSTRGREVIEQELEFMRRVPLRDVQAAQRQFVQVAQSLVDAGEIVLEDDDVEYVE
jgi:flagellar motor switch protein FliG